MKPNKPTKGKGNTLTLEKLEKAYQQAKVFDTQDDWVIPDWKVWLYRLMPWKYKEIMKGVFLVK